VSLGAAEPGRAGRDRRRVAGVVLAAGRSSRMGRTNKLLADVQGLPMVRRVTETALQAGLDPVVVVVGHDAAEVRDALEGLPIRLLDNPAFAQGLSTSVGAGIGAVEKEAEGAMVLLGDMPWVSVEDLRALMQAFSPEEGRGICVPVVGGRRGNPVLWSARHFAALCSLQGDVGGRGLMAGHADDVWEVRVPDDGVLRDIDTPEGLQASRLT
jgi:molybdenum cofactor cytidylyltransferase